MPRKSLEARAGEVWRAKLLPPPVPPSPPPDLSPAARALWRRIVKSKPRTALKRLIFPCCGNIVCCRFSRLRWRVRWPQLMSLMMRRRGSSAVYGGLRQRARDWRRSYA
jgi:hypothetical protein